MSDHSELKRLAESATSGDWQVIETELPCRLGLPHIERRIFTAKDHPQLKAPYPVVNGSVALGTDETPVHHMVSIRAEDAAFIAAANPDAVLALIAEVEVLREEVRLSDLIIAERDRLLSMFECPVHGQCVPHAMDQVEALRKDKGRIDALEANFWDVRHTSTQVGMDGDTSQSIEIVGIWMDAPRERVIGENYSENLRAAIDQAMTSDAYPPARPEYDEEEQ